MPQQAWSDKRERQYEHIKDGLLDLGKNEDTAEEIAADGEQGTGVCGRSAEASASSIDDISSGAARWTPFAHAGPAAELARSSTTKRARRTSKAARR